MTTLDINVLGVSINNEEQRDMNIKKETNGPNSVASGQVAFQFKLVCELDRRLSPNTAVVLL